MSKTASIEKYMDHELLCPHCGTIYLRIAANVKSFTLICCSTCNQPLGTWGELEASFNTQGGQSGVFAMHDGKIERKE